MGISPVSAIAAHPQGVDVERMDGTLVSFTFRGIPLRFFVHDQHDSIQAHHNVGQLYEIEELDLLLSHFEPGMRVLDVGANIGNHTVWFEKIARASRIVVIEPQPRIAKLLRLNCVLNQLSCVDFSKVGFALGNAPTRGSVRIPQAFNPAGAVIEKDPAGQVTIVRGDELVDGEVFDFVKIDVEGSELEVIEGLQGLIRNSKPIMFVEVWEANRHGFDALMHALDYEVVTEYRRYDVANNLLVRPKVPRPLT
jgi:FkbM family methyltransferase